MLTHSIGWRFQTSFSKTRRNISPQQSRARVMASTSTSCFDVVAFERACSDDDGEEPSFRGEHFFFGENRKHFLMSTLVLIDLATIFPQLVVWCIFTSGVIEWGSVRQVFPITVQPDFLVTCVQCVLDCIVYMTASQCVFTCLKTGRQTDARARATDVQLPSTRIDLHACMPIYMPCSTQHVARTRRGSSACCISSNSQRCSA